MAIPTTRDRVPEHTDAAINERIEAESRDRVRRLAQNPSAIPARLRELEAEWDIERAIEANASTLAFIGVALGFFAHPYWLILPALVTGFLFQHAVQGWCPPVPVLRRLGFRTTYEIEQERYALKALRGDFADAEGAPSEALAAVQIGPAPDAFDAPRPGTPPQPGL
jgi:hypothetical protein